MTDTRRLSEIEGRQRRLARLNGMLADVRQALKNIADVAVIDTLSEPRYSEQAKPYREQETELLAEIAEIDSWLAAQHLDLIKRVGGEVHDILRQYFPCLSNKTQLSPLPENAPARGTWAYLIPPNEPMRSVFDERLPSAMIKHGQCNLEVFATRPNGYRIIVGYAPEIDTLFIR